MNKQPKITLFFALAILASLVAVIVVGWYIDSLVCEKKWSRIAISTEWGPIQGCMVQLKSGEWVPSSSIREVSP